MKVLEKYNQSRRDCWCDMKCEGCGALETGKDAYDDRNFWDNVVPNFKCKGCGKSTKDLGIQAEVIPTRYSDYEVI